MVIMLLMQEISDKILFIAGKKGWAWPTLRHYAVNAAEARPRNEPQSFMTASSRRPEAPGLDAILLDLVAQYPEAGVQDLSCLALVAPGLAQGQEGGHNMANRGIILLMIALLRQYKFDF